MTMLIYARTIVNYHKINSICNIIKLNKSYDFVLKYSVLGNPYYLITAFLRNALTNLILLKKCFLNENICSYRKIMNTSDLNINKWIIIAKSED